MKQLRTGFYCLLVLAFFTQMAERVVARGKPSRQPVAAKIVLDQAEVKLAANQSVEIKAAVFDAAGKEISNAKVTWEVLGDSKAIVLRPLNDAQTDVLIISRATDSDSVVSVRAGIKTLFADVSVRLQDSTPAQILFLDPNRIELPIHGRATVKAYVLNARGNRIPNAEINWELSDSDHEAFVHLGPNLNKDGVNSVEISWLSGRPGLKTPSEVKLVARSGEKARAIKTIQYQTTAPEVAKITLDAKQIMLQPGDTATINVTVRSEDDKLLKDVELEAEIPDVNARKFLLVTTDKQTVTVMAIEGDDQNPTPPLLRTALVINTKGKSKKTAIPLTYLRDLANIDWTILPSNIVGDNYGRTIRKDYYCIEVTIQNNSDSDLALAALRFVGNDEELGRPNTSYTTVHGSLARRKLTHPRTMTLAIIDAAGTLLTGFNPFFHNLNHAKNYSQFIDILSNPLAKGLEKAWKDPYPDELARFEQDVLHDEKMIKANDTLKTKIFVPKRGLCPNESDGNCKTMAQVREALGQLELRAYKFQRGPVLSVATSR
jgi:hypothetical protein